MSYTGEMMETNSSHIGGTLSNFHAELVQIIDLDHGLLDELRRLKVLSRDEIQRFEYARNKEPESKSAADLITKVSHMSQEKQNTFLVALENSQQAHVSHYIRENGKLCEEDKAKWPLIECDEADVIDENWRELVETIDTEHGLLDELFAEGGINIQHMDSIKSCKRNAEKNRTLLNILLRRSFRDYRCFVDCLRKTNQLKAEALMTSVQHSNPLHSRIHVRIRTNYSALVLLIEPRYGLLDEMLQRGCITQLQKESIEASENVYVRSRRLLDMVLNMFSESDFDKFIECLEKTEQSHVCSVLQKDGVVAGLEARIRNEHDANQDEKRIVEQFMSLINRSPNERRQRLRATVNKLVDSLTVNGVTLTAVANTHSIRFYYFCETSEGLQHLHEVYSSIQFKTMTENLLTVLLDDGRSVRVESLKWIVFELGHGDDATLYSELAAPDSSEISRLIETLYTISKRKLRKRMDFESSQTHTTSGRPQSAKTNLRSQDASRPTRSAPIGHRVPPINSRA